MNSDSASAALTEAASVSSTSGPVSAPAAADLSRSRERFAALVELSKPRITRLVTITAAVGFILAALNRSWTAWELILAAFGCLVGTALASAGANGLNQWMERGRDALMPRTAKRPLPEGRLSPALAGWVSLGLCSAGCLVLWVLAGPTAALVCLATIVTYVAVYTPLKPVTQFSTIVGAVPGALPPLIGWTAAMGSAAGPLESVLHPGGMSLFVLMFIWQIPHFMAIAWLYREDYAKGGFKMLPLNDPSGRLTALVMFTWAIALLPATLWPALALPGQLGLFYVGVAVITGLAYIVASARFMLSRTRGRARAVFIFSIIHLPLLLMAMIAEALLTYLF